MRKIFFMVKEVGFWNRLSTQVMVTMSLELFKARLDGVLSSLVVWEVSVLMAGSWTWMVIQGPFQLIPFHDSVKSHGFSSFLPFVLWCGSLWSLHVPVNAVREGFQDLTSSLLSCHEIDHSKGYFPTVYLVIWEYKKPFQTCAINTKSAQTFWPVLFDCIYAIKYAGAVQFWLACLKRSCRWFLIKRGNEVRKQFCIA